MKISDQLQSLINQGGEEGICESLLAICPKTDNPTSDEGNDCEKCLFNIKNKGLFEERIQMLRVLGD